MVEHEYGKIQLQALFFLVVLILLIVQLNCKIDQLGDALGCTYEDSRWTCPTPEVK